MHKYENVTVCCETGKFLNQVHLMLQTYFESSSTVACVSQPAHGATRKPVSAYKAMGGENICIDKPFEKVSVYIFFLPN